jgi:hypothetical protein
MKSGIKTCDLRQSGEARRNGLDTLDRARQVKRRKGSEPPKIAEENPVNLLGFSIVGPAVDDTMARGVRFRKAQRAGRLGYACGCCIMRGELTADVHQSVLVSASDPKSAFRQADMLHSAGGKSQLVGISNAIEGEL